MRKRRFRAEVQQGHKGLALLLPFDPVEAWGERSRQLVAGTLNGRPFEGEIGLRRGVHYTLLDRELLAAARLAAGDAAEVEMTTRAARADETGPAPRLAWSRLATRSPLELLRAICRELPDTHETLTWGKPHFRVKEKIFAGFGEEAGRAAIGFKLAMEHAARIVADKRFWKAPYVGHKGWVSMDATSVADPAELRALVTESYRLIAPKTSLARLDGDPVVPAPEPASPRARRKPARKVTSRSRGD